MKKILRYTKYFVVTIGILMTLLFAVSCIPQKLCKDNINSTYNEFTKTDDVNKKLIPGSYSTMIDIHADSIWVDIVNYIDNTKPISSSLRASYYFDSESGEFTQFQQINAIDENKDANITYERYWHGPLIYLKPLLCVTDIHGIRIFQYAVLSVLIFATLYIMSKKKLWNMIISFVVSMITVSIWIVPYSLEYFPAFAVMFAVSIFALISNKNTVKDYLGMFFVSGILICFFDFLTTELLTLLVPYMIVMCLHKKEIIKWSVKNHFIFMCKSCLLWGAGYVLSFLAKWSMASVVLHKNAFSTAIKSAEVRVGEKVVGTMGQQWRYGLMRNIRCLLPLDFLKTYGQVIVFILGLIFFISVLFIMFGRKQNIEDKILSRLFLVIGFIPFIRFSILINHTYLHCFFTYRVLFVSIVALAYSVCSHLNIEKIVKN